MLRLTGGYRPSAAGGYVRGHALIVVDNKKELATQAAKSVSLGMGDALTQAREWAAKNAVELQKRQAQLADRRNTVDAAVMREFPPKVRISDNEALAAFIAMREGNG